MITEGSCTILSGSGTSPTTIDALQATLNGVTEFEMECEVWDEGKSPKIENEGEKRRSTL